MDPTLASMLRALRLDPEKVKALLPVIARYGARGAVVLARGYLGPVAAQVEEGRDVEEAEVARRAGLAPGELALLGMALTKLVYEAGELALHNPKVAGDGKQPEFTLDEHGRPPAVSLAHVIAAGRVLRERAADRAARARAAPPRLPPRAQLQAARAERYARAPRYAYVAPIPSRAPR